MHIWRYAARMSSRRACGEQHEKGWKALVKQNTPHHTPHTHHTEQALSWRYLAGNVEQAIVVFTRHRLVCAAAPLVVATHSPSLVHLTNTHHTHTEHAVLLLLSLACFPVLLLS